MSTLYILMRARDGSGPIFFEGDFDPVLNADGLLIVTGNRDRAERLRSQAARDEMGARFWLKVVRL